MRLDEEFIDFLKEVKGVECIDDLHLTSVQQASEKADFFFDNRTIICEVKSLQKDTKHKVDVILAPHQKRPEWPLFYGEWNLQQILKHFPDREKINEQIFQTVTSSIQECVRKGNRQIRRTKENFGTHSAGGILIVLNEFVEILSPDVMARKLTELLRKRQTDGDLQFAEINYIWSLSETHYIPLGNSSKGHPSVIVKNNLIDRDATAHLSRFLDFLQAEWAKHKGSYFLKNGGNAAHVVDTLKFERTRKEEPRPLKLHEIWREQYKRAPYLRRLSDQSLIQHFEHIISSLIPGMLKGASESQRKESKSLWEPLTHLLEEINIRGMDMRKFSKVRDEIIARIIKRKISRNAPCPCGSGKRFKKCCGINLHN